MVQTYDVVIRCRNEADWLSAVLKALKEQTCAPSKIILVDSGSTDDSVNIAKSHECSVVKYENTPFNYSESLNIGVESTSADFVLILSAHCVITAPGALSVMLDEMNRVDVAAVYGRQLPTENSSPYDVRDMLTIFGRERIEYSMFPFFHNAFSLIRKSCWQLLKFNETVNGLEDRIWAQEMAHKGYKIVYQPKAAVFHEHGLNHGRTLSRAQRVTKMLKIVHKGEEIRWPNLD